MKVNQKTGVYNAIVAFCAENDIPFEDGMSFEPTKEQRATIVGMVAAGLEAHEIEMSDKAREKYTDLSKLKTYSNGLVSNWVRKDKRLNGGVKHVIKNPGSRAGSGDAILRELRKLRKTLTDEAQIAVVDTEIEKRIEIVQAEKAKKVEINTDLLPEELLGLVSTNA